MNWFAHCVEEVGHYSLELRKEVENAFQPQNVDQSADQILGRHSRIYKFVTPILLNHFWVNDELKYSNQGRLPIFPDFGSKVELCVVYYETESLDLSLCQIPESRGSFCLLTTHGHDNISWSSAASNLSTQRPIGVKKSRSSAPWMVGYAPFSRSAHGAAPSE